MGALVTKQGPYGLEPEPQPFINPKLPNFHVAGEITLYKILLIGNHSVGKTSLLLRYTEDTFSSLFMPTIGIDFKIRTMTIGQKQIKLQIWDIGNLIVLS